MSGREESFAAHQFGIVGTGLIGTSIGLALARGSGPPAFLVDANPTSVATAVALGAGRQAAEGDLLRCDHIVIAVPPKHVIATLLQLQQLNLQATFSDVASVKSKVVAEAETAGVDLGRFCPGHPVAGRERGGPTAAQPELFDDAVWVATPTLQTSERARADVRTLAVGCGAKLIEMTPQDHDQALAVVSHLPQLVASLLAAALPSAGADGAVLAGRGFRDTTRLADSDAELWVQIALANSVALAAALAQHGSTAARLADSLAAGNESAVRAALGDGHRARSMLPTKRQSTRVTWARLGVVLADRPGELARLFSVAGEAAVNIEDVTIDHATDHPVGIAVIDVAEDQVETLYAAASAAGWHVARY